MGASSSSERYAAQGSTDLVSVTRKVSRAELPPPIDLSEPAPFAEKFYRCVSSVSLGRDLGIVQSDNPDAEYGFELRFRVVGRLGSGVFGDVYTARREILLNNRRWTLVDDKLYALKIFPADESAELDGRTSFERELEAVRELFNDPDTHQLMAPLVQQGNLRSEGQEEATTYYPYLLFDLITPTVTLSTIIPILQASGYDTVKNGIIRRVAETLEQLHTRNDDRPGVAHRDLHGGNVLIVNSIGVDMDALERAWQDKFFGTDAEGNFLYPGAAVIKNNYPDFLTRALPSDGCVVPEPPVLLQRYLELRAIIFNATRELADSMNKTYEEFNMQMEETNNSFLDFERQFVPFEIRLIDFGKALILDDNDRRILRVSDPMWWIPGPNAITGPRVDVWQMSVLAFLMTTGRNALQPGVPEAVYQTVERRSQELRVGGPDADIQEELLADLIGNSSEDLTIDELVTWPSRQWRGRPIDYFTMLDVFGANFTGNLILPPPFFWMSGPAIVDDVDMNEIPAVASINPEDRPSMKQVIEQAAKAEAGLI